MKISKIPRLLLNILFIIIMIPLAAISLPIMAFFSFVASINNDTGDYNSGDSVEDEIINV